MLIEAIATFPEQAQAGVVACFVMPAAFARNFIERRFDAQSRASGAVRLHLSLLRKS